MENVEKNRPGGGHLNPPPPAGRSHSSSSTRVSPVPSSSGGAVGVNPVAAATAAAVNAAPATAKRTNDSNAASSSGDGSRAAKKAKTVSDIEKEVRELLDEKLTGSDDDKVGALDKMYGYFVGWNDVQSYPLHEEHRCAVMEWDGCHLGLNALRSGLNNKAAGGPNRQVVSAAMRFLTVWNTSNDERRDAMLRFNGVGAVARTMQAYPQDVVIQRNSIICLYNFALPQQAPYRHALIEGGCVPLIVHALTVVPPSAVEQRVAINLLEFLCNVEGQDHAKLLLEKGALVAAAKAYETNSNSDDPEAPTILEASRRLMSKLHG